MTQQATCCVILIQKQLQHIFWASRCRGPSHSAALADVLEQNWGRLPKEDPLRLEGLTINSGMRKESIRDRFVENRVRQRHG